MKNAVYIALSLALTRLRPSATTGTYSSALDFRRSKIR